MTQVNGLRLAYRGFVAGLAAAYVWAAIAMVLSGLLHSDPLWALRPFAVAITPVAGTPELAFVLGLALVQLGGAFTGMVFAYFFARFFTIRATLRLAAPAVAILAWTLITIGIGRPPNGFDMAADVAPIVATLGYGAILGAGVPVRAEVSRAGERPSA